MFLRKAFRILGRVLLAILLLVVLLWGALQTQWGQNWAVRQVTSKLSKDLQTKVSIAHVDFDFFNRMELKGVYLEDQRGDTLLYAGEIGVRITDWFFLKDKAVLEYVSLADAQVHFNRTDSVWNYTFLQKYFSSSSSKPKDTSAKAGIVFNLKTMALKNVSFIQRDKWAGTDMHISVASLDLDAKEISFSGPVLQIRNLNLVDPVFESYSYKGLRPFKPLSSSSPFPEIRVEALSIQNGTYRTDVEGKTPVAGVFDPEHIDFTGIYGRLNNVGFTDNILKGFIDLKAKERSGLIVHELKAETTIGPGSMIFDKLLLKTNRSTITDFLSLTYEDNMRDFQNRVKIDANFSKAVISSEDLAFFATEAKTWNRKITVNGKISGTVADLTARNLEVWAGNNTYIKGNLSLVGLPDIESTYINLQSGELRTTYADAVSFIPSLKKITKPDLKALQYLRFKGNFTGFTNDFVTFGTVSTALGTIVSDLNMKIPAKGDPRYSGKIATSGFELGRFLRNDKLGTVDFSGRLAGSGFDSEKLNLNIDGNVRRFDYDGYTYRDITAKGNLKNKKFNGSIISRDPNADLSITGLIDFSGDQPRFDAIADIRSVNLRQLNLTKENVLLKGRFEVDFNGGSLSDLLGNARIRNAVLTHNGKQIPIDSLIVSTTYANGVKTLSLNSDQFNAIITGNFDLANLPNSFTYFLNRYYPAYIRVPGNVKQQAFTFDITTGVVEEYIEFLIPGISGFNNSHVSGSLNTFSNTMNVDADIPYLEVKNYTFSDIQIQGNGNLEKLVINGQVNNSVISSSLTFPQTTFSIEAQNDISNIIVNTSSNQTINKANLAAQIRTFDDGVSILFNPSSFVLNGKNWNIEQGGELNFRRNTVVQGELLVRESNQEVQIRTELSGIGNWNDLHVTLKNINLGDLSPFITPNNRLEGLLNGQVVVQDPQNKRNVVADLGTEELRFDNDSLGQVRFSGNYNSISGLLTGAGNNLDTSHYIDFDLAMNLKDSAGIYEDRISLHPRNFELKYLSRFLNTLFTDIEGTFTGDVDILGEGANRRYLAEVDLDSAAFTVQFTKVKYFIEDTKLALTGDYIDLNGIRLRDVKNNYALVRGGIRHEGFKNMYLDLQIRTESEQMQLLNTSANDNQQFYGRAWGTGNFVMVGPQNNLLMYIDVAASETDSSWITIPPANSRQSGQAGFMVEKKYGREMNPALLSGSASNIRFEVTLTANPMVNMEVIIDELTGDEIKGRGSGVLSISSGTNLPLSINGRYNIDEGSYLFTFQSFFKKPFILRPGANNFIEWSGDPYDANINLVASYTAEKVSFAPLANTLLASGSGDQNLQSLRSDVNVVATLTGKLFEPSFQFNLEFPSTSNIYRNQNVAFGIQQIERNPNELNKQVTYLIVFNSFAPYEGQTSNSNVLNETISSTLSGILFGQLNQVLNRALSSVLNKANLTVNLSGSVYNRNLVNTSFGVNRTDLNVRVGKSFFEGRVLFTVGGTLDMAIPGSQDVYSTTRLFSPDVIVEFLINPSGSVRASFFYRENADFFGGSSSTAGGLQTKRYGANISYTKQFDSFGEALGKEKKLSKRGKAKPATAAVSDSTSTSAN